MSSLLVIVFTIAASGVLSAPLEDYEYVTCGSIIKLTNQQSDMRLHSHEINWGSGSGQQSVTAHGSVDDPNSLWIVKEAHGAQECVRGAKLPCGSSIRLEHASTRRNLHSHQYRSPIGGNQEVSGFGHVQGDRGDNWTVQCSGSTGYWMRETPFHLQHTDTAMFLYTGRRNLFTHQNCPNCPIVGQQEVSAQRSMSSETEWVADLGIYFN